MRTWILASAPPIGSEVIWWKILPCFLFVGALTWSSYLNILTMATQWLGHMTNSIKCELYRHQYGLYSDCYICKHCLVTFYCHIIISDVAKLNSSFKFNFNWVEYSINFVFFSPTTTSSWTQTLRKLQLLTTTWSFTITISLTWAWPSSAPACLFFLFLVVYS